MAALGRSPAILVVTKGGKFRPSVASKRRSWLKPQKRVSRADWEAGALDLGRVRDLRAAQKFARWAAAQKRKERDADGW